MKRLLLTVLAGALVATAASAGSKACTAGMVSAGVCRTTAERVIYLSVHQDHVQDVVDALADEAGWVSQVTCTQALVDLGQCLVGQLGQLVANPITKVQAADAQFRFRLINLVRSYKAESVHATAEQTRQSGLAAIVDPNVGD